jgi:hypothetical protein
MAKVKGKIVVGAQVDTKTDVFLVALAAKEKRSKSSVIAALLQIGIDEVRKGKPLVK